MASVSYAEWLSLLAAVRTKGLSCEELEQIQQVYPQNAGQAYEQMIYNEIGKLEEYMLKESFRRFQRGMNLCLEEMDIEEAGAAINRLKGHIRKCLFFLRIPEYPEMVKTGMTEEIKRILDSYLAEFSKYLRQLEYSDNSAFTQELVYLCRKRLLKANLL